jgi:DNA polymerase I
MLINSETFSEALRQIEKVETLSVDTETTGLQLHTKDVVAGVSVYHPDINGFYFPVRYAMQVNITPDQYQQLLAVLSKVKTFIGHNTKFDRHALNRDGYQCTGVVVDTVLGAQLLDENQSLKLKLLGNRYLKVDSSEEEKELTKTLDSWGLSKGDMWQLPPKVSSPYAIKDAKLAWDLSEFIREKLPGDLNDLWLEINDYSDLLRRMEKLGILVDVERMAALKAEAFKEANALNQQLRTLFKRPINVNSPAQVASVFATVDATEETLMTIKHVPGVMEVLRYKWYMKAINTYYNKYPSFMDGNNVIHTDYNPTGTDTGRLSSSDPNLTAIPRYTPEQKIKDVFISRPGFTFVEADYSQAEIRVAAHYTQDKAVLSIFENGLDYHGETAKALGIDRQKAKVLNLAINYGAGVNALVKQIGIKEKDVKSILADYHAKFPGFRKASKEFESLAEQRGYIRYWTGRRRHFDGVNTEARKAFNSAVQGGTAEMVRRTMQRLDNELPEVRQILQVHDSIVAEIPDGSEDNLIPKIREIMEDQPWCRVKMEVDVKTGKRLSEMKPYA